MATEPTKQPIKAKSFIGWVGGKSQLTSTIIPLIPDHKAYVEVFAGAAWMLFRKPPSEVEIINDINGELTTLYRVIQFHLEEFVRYFKWMLVSREEFERMKVLEPEQMTDIQRSARFYYLIKNGFGAKVTNPSFGVSATQRPRMNLVRIEEDLSEAHLRLARVYVENRTYEQCITRFDKPGTFFYVDPPYWDCENDYGKGLFAKADFERLAALLGKVQGKWLMSINDVPQIRELFKGFQIRAVPTKYSIGATGSKAVQELLISNYKLPK